MRFCQSGFTLVEFIITITITIIVSTLLVVIFSQNNSLFYSQQAKVSHGISSNTVISRIDDAIRQAITISTAYPAESPEYTSNQSTLILQLASIDQSGSTIPDSFDYQVFTPDKSNSKILRQLTFPAVASSRSARNEVIATNLKSINFVYLNDTKSPVIPSSATIVSYTLNLASPQVNVTVDSSASGQTRLRNN